MYVTRQVSACRRQPGLLQAGPPEGPFSGVLVIQDEEAGAEATCCFGLCKDTSVNELPVPQNKTITMRYSSGSDSSQSVSHDYVMLIPVVNQPLSSNTYYAIQAKGKRQGEAHTSSTEEDMKTCCICSFINDVKSRALDPNNPLQQFQLYPRPTACSTYSGFECKSVSPDAFPPYFLRRTGWTMYAETPKDFSLGEARGLDADLRSRLPGFDFPIGNKTSARVGVGKWYVPFMFVKESGRSLKEQMKKSMYYEMTLEQRWEKIFESENNEGGKSSVAVEATVRTEVVLLGERVAASGGATEGVMWWCTADDAGGVGLNLGIVERMKWEEKRACWDGNGGKMRVETEEELSGHKKQGWSRYGCYVVVESFALKRMDGSLVITFDFYHTHQTRSKWE